MACSPKRATMGAHAALMLVLALLTVSHAAMAAESRIPLYAGPLMLTQPGTYYLSENVTSSIMVPGPLTGLTLDLNGKSITVVAADAGSSIWPSPPPAETEESDAKSHRTPSFP